MPSNFIKIMLALTGLSPAILLLYFVKIVHNYSDLSIYINIKSFDQAIRETGNFLVMHYLLLIFIILIFVAYYIVSVAKKRFAISRIEVKSIKPSDINFTTILFSVTPSLVKLYTPTISDGVLLGIFLIIGVVLGLILKASYHFNLTLKLFLGYNNYEVQTTGEVTYLALSRKKLINKKAFTEYVYLTDYMLLNVSK